jgi:small subunit ribosomal protein S4e
MHLTRQAVTRKVPIERKGTKYVARALEHFKDAVPVVIAVRDMLKLAKTRSEVQNLINRKLLKLNGRAVRDVKESIKLFNIFEADKKYILSILPTGRFALKETKASERLCKVVNKTIVSGKEVQLNLGDGSNVITKEKISVGDSLYLDFEGKIKKHVRLEKSSEVFVTKGRYVGHEGRVLELRDGKALVKFKTGEAELPTAQLVAQ